MKFTAFTILLVVFIGSSDASLCVRDYIAERLNIPANQRGHFKDICEKCMGETGVTFKQLTDNERNLSREPELAVQCYFQCYGLTYGSIDASGTLQQDMINTLLDESGLLRLQDCLPSPIDESRINDKAYQCRRIYSIYSCYFKNDKCIV